MNTKTIGNTDVKIPGVCIGTMGFSENTESARAWAVDYETSKGIVKECIDAGLNFFDTAPVYSNGSSEKALGQALKDLNVPRENVVIATKYYPRSNKEIEAGVSMKEHIRSWLEGSLKRLQSDYVDLLFLHMWDWNTPIEETIEAVEELIQQGKIKAAGLSNVHAWQAAMANEKAAAMNAHPFAAIENQWNLISREEENEMIPCADHYGMTCIPYASLAAGRLARPLGTQTKRSELDAYGEKKFSTQKEADSKVIESLEEVAKEVNAPMSSVALAWLIHKGAVPLAGATKPRHIQGIKEALDIKLNEDQLKRLEENYVPHIITGVLAEHTPSQDCYEYYNVYSMKDILPNIQDQLAEQNK